MNITALMCAAAATLGAAVGIASTSAIAAVPGGCGTRGNYHAGATSAFNSTVYGSRAEIEYNNPDLCGDDSTGVSASTVWSMVTAHSNASPTNGARDGWAQAGYGQFAANSGFAASGFHVFGQYTYKCKNAGNCSGAEVNTKFGGTVTVSHYYSNYVRPSDGYIRMDVDSTQLNVTNYNPAGDWDSAYAGQFAGEVVHPESDVPGTAADVTSFDYLEKYDSSGYTAFFQTVNPVTPQYSRHHVSITSPSVGGTGINVWTSPLTSY